jgi:hypothetical protein
VLIQIFDFYILIILKDIPLMILHQTFFFSVLLSLLFGADFGRRLGESGL